jgi:hypothetical protein
MKTSNSKRLFEEKNEIKYPDQAIQPIAALRLIFSFGGNKRKKLFPPITVGNSANIIFPITGIDAIRVYSTRKLLEDTFSKNIKTIALTLSASPPRKIP